MTDHAASTTVAGYLKERLEQLGLDRMFGVAGNYTAPFLDTILADDSSPIAISGNPNEICAGYAADRVGQVGDLRGPPPLRRLRDRQTGGDRPPARR